MKRRNFVTMMFAGFLPGAVAVEGSTQSGDGRLQNARSRESEGLADWAVKVARRVKVATGAPRHRAFPAVERLRNGDILVLYCEGNDHWRTPDGIGRLVRSKDGGMTWLEPRTILQSKGVNYGTHQGISQMSDGTILLPAQSNGMQSGPEFFVYAYPANYGPVNDSSGLGPRRITRLYCSGPSTTAKAGPDRRRLTWTDCHRIWGWRGVAMKRGVCPDEDHQLCFFIGHKTLFPEGKTP